MEPRLSQPRHQCFSVFSVHKTCLAHLLHTDSQTPHSAILTIISMTRWDPVFSISNKLPGDADLLFQGYAHGYCQTHTLNHWVWGFLSSPSLHLPSIFLAAEREAILPSSLNLQTQGWFSSESNRLKFCIAFCLSVCGGGRGRGEAEFIASRSKLQLQVNTLHTPSVTLQNAEQGS